MSNQTLIPNQNIPQNSEDEGKSSPTGLWGMGDTVYDKLVSIGRTWLPIIAAILAIISATFTQLSGVPGLESWAPWLVGIAGVLSAVSAGLNQILKISKDIYKSECKSQESAQAPVTQ